MNTEAKIELAKRAVACLGWRWMPGMRTVRTIDTGDGVTVARCVSEDEDRNYPFEEEEPRGWDPDVFASQAGGHSFPGVGPWLPDFDDDGTRGCLLALVKLAWPGCDVSVATKWDRVPDGQGGLRADTERVVVEIRWPCARVSSIWFNCRSFLGYSLGESLAEALIAAPEKAATCRVSGTDATRVSDTHVGAVSEAHSEAQP